jgi:hypothetical protein
MPDSTNVLGDWMLRARADAWTEGNLAPADTGNPYIPENVNRYADRYNGLGVLMPLKSHGDNVCRCGFLVRIARPECGWHVLRAELPR